MSESAARREGHMPRELERTLRRLIRRARMVLFVRGVAATASVAVGSVLVAMAVDYHVTFMSSWPRWALAGGALTATLAALAVFLVRPLARSFTMSGIARAVEAHHPELEERVSSAVELLSSRDRPELRGSEALIGALVDEASQDVRGLQPRREVTLRAARPFLLAAAAVLLVLSALLVAWPDHAPRMLMRAVAPFLNLPNVAADQLSVQPGDTAIRPGERLGVEVRVDNASVHRVDLHVRKREGNRKVIQMSPVMGDNGRRFTRTCPPADEDFSYRVHAGEALTRWYHVTVAPPPSISRLDVRYEYPDYIGRQPLVAPESDGSIEAVAGTRVTITATVDKPIQGSELSFNGTEGPPVVGEMESSADAAVCTFEFTLTPGLDATYHMTMTDHHGFTNPEKRHAVRALPDRPPRVHVGHPRERQLRCRPGDSVPVAYVVRDDFGLAEAAILLGADGNKVENLAVPLPQEEATVPATAAGEAMIDLSAPPLARARRVTFRLRGRDTLPAERGGPQEDLSPTFTIVIDREAAPYAQQMRETLEEGIRSQLQRAREELEEARTESADLRQRAVDGEGAPERMGNLGRRLAGAEAALRDAQTRAQATPYASLAPAMEEIVEGELSRARSAAMEMELAEEPAERGQMARTADYSTEAALAEVSELTQEFEQMAEAMARAQELGDLAGRERELSASAQGLPEGTEPPDEWITDQRQLAAETGELMPRVPGTPPALAAEGAERISSLAETARRLAGTQEALAGDTERLRELDELGEELARLAEEQDNLAGRAAAEDHTAGQERTMRAAAQDLRTAAQDLRTDMLPEAMRKQRGAAEGLNREAEELRRQEATATLADKAAQIARRQKQLAERVAASGEAARAQQELRQELEGLRGDAGRATGDARRAVRRHDPGDAMEKAANMLAGEKPEQAAEPLKTAVERTDQLSSALAEEVQSMPPVENRPGRADSAAQLASDQEALRREVERIRNRRRRLQDELRESRLARIQRAQQELAAEATRLAYRVGRQQVEADGLEREAAQSAHEASRELQSVDLPEAADSAAGAAEALEQLDARLARAEPQQAALAETAGELAARQRRLTAEIEAAAEDRTSGTVALQQEHLREETTALGERARALSRQMRDGFGEEPVAQAAGEAAASLGEAVEAEGLAVEALAGNDAASALPPQGEALRALGEAAGALQETGRLYAESAGALPLAGAPAAEEQASRSSRPAGRHLSEAAASAQAAAEQASPALASEAAEQFGRAQAAALAAARRTGVNPMSPRQQARALAGLPSQADRNSDAPRRMRRDDIVSLEEAGIELTDWSRLPGTLRNDILQAAGEKSPEEYRALIRRYFREIARRGAASTETGEETE